MAKEEVVLDFKVEQGEAIAELEQTKVAIINLKKEQKELNDQYKKGSISTEQYAKSSVKLEGELKKNTVAYNENLKASKGITTQFDKLIQGLDKVVPGLGGVTSGFNGMTKGALGFIATPIGAIIGALGLALGAVMSYLKGTEEGQHRLNSVMNVGAAVLGRVTDAVQAIGKFIVDYLIKGFKLFGDALSYIIPGFDDFVKKSKDFLNLDTASGISDMEKRAVLLNRELITKRDILKAEIEDAKLRAESTKDAKLRAEALKEVGDKTNELFNKEKELAELQRDIAIERGKQANNTIEDNDKIEEAKARIFQIERDRSAALKENATKELALSEQDKALSKAKIDLKRKEDEELAEIERARARRQVELQYQTGELTLEEKIAKEAQINAIDEGSAKKSMDTALKALGFKIAQFKAETEGKKKEAQIQMLVESAKADAVLNIFRQGQALAKEGTVLAKALGVAVATVDTYKAANLALATYPPPFGAILAGVNIATGLANVTKILGITAAAGGGSFETRGPQLMVVGDNPGGRERVDVTPISGRGQTRVGGGMIQMAGGGSIVANSSSGRIDSSFGSLLKDMNLSVSWREGQELGNKIKFKEDLVTL